MKTLFVSIKITIVFCLILFFCYVLVLCGFSWLVKPNHGEAELLKLGNTVVGAANIGQEFTKEKYFWGRPSAVDYNGSGSGGSNQAVSNSEYHLQNADFPSELLTASASGLDPHISPEAAAVQIRRVANARSFSEERLREIVSQHTERPIIGVSCINVLKLNIALDNEKNN